MMRKTSLLAFILTLTFFSCSKKEVEIPSHILRKDQMASILSDIHLAQSAVSIQAQDDALKHPVSAYVPLILEKHGTDEKQFAESLNFYSQHPDVVLGIYDSVITRLNRIQGEVEGK